MEARLTRNGWLKVKRPDGWKAQLCPFDAYTDDVIVTHCGTGCPLFVLEESLATLKQGALTTKRVVILSCAPQLVKYDLVEE